MRLNSLNKKIEVKLGYRKEEPVVPARGDAVREKYENYFNKNTVFDMSFDSCAKDGSFSRYDGEWFIVLLPEDPTEEYTEYTIRTLDRMIGTVFQVQVESIDESAKRVYVTLAGKSKASREAALKSAINREIEQQLNKGNEPRVWGSIIKVYEKYALVNILDQNIVGFIYLEHWQRGFTRSMKVACEKGEHYQFDIIRRAPKSEGKPTAWILSRRKLAGNPWDAVDFTGIEEGAVLIVKCVEKPVGKTYWWGSSDRVPGVSIMGDYNGMFNEDNGLVAGLRYRCKIVEFENGERPKERKLKVSPYDVVDEDRSKLEACKRVKGGK